MLPEEDSEVEQWWCIIFRGRLANQSRKSGWTKKQNQKKKKKQQQIVQVAAQKRTLEIGYKIKILELREWQVSQCHVNLIRSKWRCVACLSEINGWISWISGWMYVFELFTRHFIPYPRGVVCGTRYSRFVFIHLHLSVHSAFSFIYSSTHWQQ